MNRQTFTWGRCSRKLRQQESWLELLCLLGLLLAALVLFGVNLDSLPLRDWDEGTVAQVAKEIWHSDFNSLHWLFPTLWGEPYLNKPPLVHDLIALTYAVEGEVTEWAARWPGAMLTAVSVPLLYSVGREIFARRTPALFSALIYLTFLPVVRHGRLAMLDGAVLCFTILTILCLLRSRRDLRWALGVGLGLGLISLTKGMMALLIGAIALIFLGWDTPRLLQSSYFWLGVFLGISPAIAWYVAQWLHYQQMFTDALHEQFFKRIWERVDDHSGPPWYYLLEIGKYSWPGLIFCLWGLRLAWENRNWSWAKLVLVWSAIYFLAVSLMATKLPWYILPIYPALALSGGFQLAEIYCQPCSRPYPRNWLICFGLLTILASLASFYFTTAMKYDLGFICAFVALTMAISAILLARRNPQFMAVLFWGMYVALIVFVSSPHWLWELNEAYPVQPAAAIIQKYTPPQENIYTSFAYERPSLNFYSARRVIPATPEELEQYWQENPQPYLWLDNATLEQLNLESTVSLKQWSFWQLITKNTATHI
jgi:4-amino-4-deoxy-L-arabinose transferase-like glycosyltransferase